MEMRVSQLTGVPGHAPDAPAGGKRTGGFQSLLWEAIQRVESLGRAADDSVLKLLAGENEEVHRTVLAVQRAELAFQLFLEVRNKLVQAYQEIMRMPI